jgi:hypothetical protein
MYAIHYSELRKVVVILPLFYDTRNRMQYKGIIWMYSGYPLIKNNHVTPHASDLHKIYKIFLATYFQQKHPV